MRVKHVFRVVGSQFVDAAELNELLVNAKGKSKRRSSVGVSLLVDNRRHKPASFDIRGGGGLLFGGAPVPRVSKLLLFLDVAVGVKVAVELPLVQLVDLVL